MNVLLKKEINSFLPESLTAGEWYVIINRIKKMMTLQEASLFLNLGKNRISKLSNPKVGILTRAGHGFVTTKSVLDYHESRSSVPGINISI